MKYDKIDDKATTITTLIINSSITTLCNYVHVLGLNEIIFVKFNTIQPDH